MLKYICVILVFLVALFHKGKSQEQIQLVATPSSIAVSKTSKLSIECAFNVTDIPDFESLKSITLFHLEDTLTNETKVVASDVGGVVSIYDGNSLESKVLSNGTIFILSDVWEQPVKENAGVYICAVQARLSLGRIQEYSERVEVNIEETSEA